MTPNSPLPADPARLTALITGASAGIGAEFARQLARKGYDLILTARRAERLAALAAELEQSTGVRCQVLPCDLSCSSALEELCATLQHCRVDYLVNNAGYGVPTRFTEVDWNAHHRFLQVLLTAFVRLTHTCLPGMLERNYGRIVNVASLAAFLPGTRSSTLYTPVKAFMLKTSQALAAELSTTNIHVCALCPGFTYTEFHDVNGTREGMNAALPSLAWMPVAPVVEADIRAVERRQVVCVPGAVNQVLKSLITWLPDRLLSQLWRRPPTSTREASGSDP